MNNYQLTADKVTQIFGRRLIFNEINFNLKTGDVLGLAGHNGSGKSTLAKIIIGIISPTKGKIVHQENNEKIAAEKLHNYIGFVSPYLVLYDEFTAEENLQHFARIRGIDYDKEKVKNLMEKFKIYDRRNDLLKAYSSGMKQRMKVIFSLLHSPKLLILDEPTSNLDLEGKEQVYEIIKEKQHEHLTIIASNEQSDLDLCNNVLQLEEFKKNNR
jgi:ABC-type multidrug transport system ATPase subunit